MECVHGASALAAASAPLGWGLWRWFSAHKPTGEQVFLWVARGFLFSVAMFMLAAGLHYDYPFMAGCGGALLIMGAILMRIDLPPVYHTRRSTRRIVRDHRHA